MVIDTSALLAILQDEPERPRFNEAVEAAAGPLLSTATFVEASIVIDARYGAPGLHDLDLYLDRARVELVEVDVEQAVVARDACSRFGRGRHPAALNLGACFSYALARTRGRPLLFKGEDVARTDVTPALQAGSSAAPRGPWCLVPDRGARARRPGILDTSCCAVARGFRTFGSCAGAAGLLRRPTRRWAR